MRKFSFKRFSKTLPSISGSTATSLGNDRDWETVHYMCRESIINYLLSNSDYTEQEIRFLIVNHELCFNKGDSKKIDELLSAIKVCDPACGSGAFLVGMLHEIVVARRTLNLDITEHHYKKETIENCIYGVDIDPDRDWETNLNST